MVLLGLMGGCVTEHSGGTQMFSDPDAALDKRGALARQYIGVGDWENAKRNLELAQEVDPNNAEVFEAFALVYQSTGEFEMAENQFRAALKAEDAIQRAQQLCGFPLFSGAFYRGGTRVLSRDGGHALQRSPHGLRQHGALSAAVGGQPGGRRSGLYPRPVDGPAQFGGGFGDGFSASRSG